MINNLRKQQKAKICTVYHNYNLSTKNFDGKLLYDLFLAGGHVKKRDIKFQNPDSQHLQFRSESRKQSKTTIKSQSNRNFHSQHYQMAKRAMIKLVQSKYIRGRHTTQLMNFRPQPQSKQTKRQCYSGIKMHENMYRSMQAKNTKNQQQTIKTVKYQRLNSTSITMPNKRRKIISAKRQTINVQDFLKAQIIQADPWIQGKLGGFSAEYISVMSNSKRIYSYQGDVRREIASLTKIMTCITSLYLAKKYEIDIKKQQIKVSRRAAGLNGTSAGLMAGDIIKMYDLLHGMMLPSGNDAAQALADFFSKFIHQKTKQQEKLTLNNQKQLKKKETQNTTIDLIFLRQMNNLAFHLKMKNTRFDNSHGLSNKNNYSSANDIVQLCHYSMKNPEFRSIVKCKQYECKIFRSHQKMNKIVKWVNTNKLLSLDYCQGIKTGITPTAGPCMAASFEQEGFAVIIVILNAKNKSKRFHQVKNLYEWAYQQSKG